MASRSQLGSSSGSGSVGGPQSSLMEPSSSSTSAGSNGSSFGNGSAPKASSSSMGVPSVHPSPSLGPVDPSAGVGRGPGPAPGPSGPIPSGSHHRRAVPIARHNFQLYQAHTSELAAYISSIFLPSVLPTPEEYQAKEQTRQYLETLAEKVSPGARLLPFGSIASGLALRNSDMDLCCVLETTENKEQRSPSELVEALGSLIQQETAFMVKMLPKARIPIIKLSLAPSHGQPFGLSCDIGFENRLALENTRLLLTYAMVDPRMRTMVLFIKVWTKRRKINDPYLGTLSSYGYVLLVIFYLINARRIPVLPNLQQLPMPRPMTPEELEHQGHYIYFFDDLDALPSFWTAANRENVAELLLDFFRHFAATFRYSFDVVSIRTQGGLLSKDEKGWLHDHIEEGSAGRGYSRVDLNRLCIEDPFQCEYNVARTVTRDGLFTIRGEFMRAVRILSNRPDRIDQMIRELCEERQEGVLMAPPSNTSRRKSAPQYREREPSPIPPLPLTASQGSGPLRSWTSSNGVSMPASAPPVGAAQYPPSLYPPRRHSPRRQSSLEPVGGTIPEDDDFPQNFPQPPSPDPGYPQLTTSRMHDHSVRQGAAVDARPRYPPESVASEPAPIDRDLEWNRDSGTSMPPSSSSTSSNGGLAAAAAAAYPRFFADQSTRVPTQTATAPASPQRTATDSQARSASQQASPARRRTTDSQAHPMSSFLINGRTMPDFSRFPMGPIRFGNFGPDGLGMMDASSGPTEPVATSAADRQSKGLSMNGVPGSPTTPRATARTPNTVADIGIPPRTPGSPAQLSRKIVFGDVEVSTDALREAREKALAALLRKRRPTMGPKATASSNANATEPASSGNGSVQPPSTPPRLNGVGGTTRHSRGHDPGSPTTPLASQLEFGTAARRTSGADLSKSSLANGSLSASPTSSTSASAAPSAPASAPTSPTSFASLSSPVPTAEIDAVAKAMAGLSSSSAQK